MESRNLDVTLHYAKGLTDIRSVLKTKAYGKVSITGYGDSTTAEKTAVDKKNKCNPVWNNTVTLTIPENAVKEGASNEIVIELFCKRSVKWDGKLGEVKLPLPELFGNGPSGEIVDRPVGGTAGGRGNAAGGALTFSYKFGDKFTQPTVRINPPRHSAAFGGTVALAATAAADVVTSQLLDLAIEGGDDEPADN